MTSAFDTLSNRGFVAQSSDDELPHRLAKEKITVYAGFDPTADSLHLGHLVPVMALAHFQQAGHQVVVLVGGATGMIGDPSGRSNERNLLTPDQVAHNADCLMQQMANFFEFHGPNAPILVNNYDWISRMSFIDWLRVVGKQFTVNYMLAKDSVKRRLESEQGISYTEFSYMTMQAFDFLHLFDVHDCTLQCGGSDQWGNITAGIDLVRKERQASVAGLTFPLVTTSSGDKFGKSAGNAVWLDSTRTSPWDLYQYLVRQDDQDVIRFLKLYTFLPLERIAELEAMTQATPENREAQKALAFEVTRRVHGDSVARERVAASETLFGHHSCDNLTDETLAEVCSSVPNSSLNRRELQQGIGLSTLLLRSQMVPSRSEALRRIKSGGIYINNRRVDDDATIDSTWLTSPSFILLRSGKKTLHLVRIVDRQADAE